MSVLRSRSYGRCWRAALKQIINRRCHGTHSHSHAPSQAEVNGARLYCQQLLSKHDYPAYVLSTFIPSQMRDAYLAIRAFNIDTARVADQVSNTTVGQMRMHFWRDAIEKTYKGHPPKEPVAVLISKVLEVDKAPLSKGFWLKVIAAREQYLGNPPFTSLDTLESYSESTYSSLHYLALESLSLQSIMLDHIASHIGKASGIVAILRGTPLLATPPAAKSHSIPSTSFNAAVILPIDVCAKHGLRQEDLIRQGGAAEGLKDTVFEIATRANDHLITAREMGEAAGSEATGVAFGTFLPAIPTALYLERLEKCGFDLYHASLQRREWKLPWRAYRAFSQKVF